MRRQELASGDPALWQELTLVCREGILSLTTADGYPRALAVNFAADGEDLWFHGALDGEKFSRLRAEPRVGFSMIQPLAYLPSSWFSAESACPATQLFRSIEVKGRCRLVEDPGHKARALQLLMDKYQPEGGFPPLAPDHPAYTAILQKTGIFRVEPDRWSGKVKLLQNAAPATVDRILGRLAARGEPVDVLTADLIRRYRPAGN